MTKKRIADGIYMRSDGKLVVHKGRYDTIFWNANMISDMKRYYPDTPNIELTELFGISESTLIRKARELGLKKSKEYLSKCAKEGSVLGVIENKKLGWPGRMKPGHPYYERIKKIV